MDVVVELPVIHILTGAYVQVLINDGVEIWSMKPMRVLQTKKEHPIIMVRVISISEI